MRRLKRKRHPYGIPTVVHTAKAALKPTKRTAEDIVIRNLELRKLRARGWSTDELAKHYHLSHHGVYKILRKAANRKYAELHREMNRLLMEIVQGFEQDMREATEILDMIPKKFAAYKIGALKARIEARERWIEALKALGFIKPLPTTMLHGALTPEAVAKILHDGPVASPSLNGQQPDETQTPLLTAKAGNGEAS